MEYKLKPGSNIAKSNDSLVEYVAQKFLYKQNVWNQRKAVLDDLQNKLRFLLSVYNSSQGNVPRGGKQRKLYYKSMLAHQAFNTLMGSKLQPDFVDYAPLGIEHDKNLLYKAEALTRAHKTLRYQGLYDLAKQQSKKDLIWGNSFIEMVLKFDGDEVAGVEYQNAPWSEMRNFYGEPDRMRVIEYSPEAYAEEYGEDELADVSLGGIVDSMEDSMKPAAEKKSFTTPEGIIQVVRYYNPARKIFAEIHGGNGKIYQSLEGDKYPLIGRNGAGFDPFMESRFYEDPTANFFGWSVFDFLVDFANLDTTITNAVTSDMVWDASAPTFVETNDPDRMRAELRRFEKDRASGKNRIIVEKESAMGLKGRVTNLAKGARTDLIDKSDELIIGRATRASNIDFNSLAEYAPTAEQQQMKKVEADKLNIRVLMLNEQREIEFARKEMYFLQNTKTIFSKYEIEVEDEFSEKHKSPEGFRPMKKMKIGDILKGADKLHLQISPRLEGALDDMTVMEIQAMQTDLGLMPQGTQAQMIALEKYVTKKNPKWGIKRDDFATPAAPQQQAMPQDMQQPELAKQLA